jgi:hypothetical protein
MSPHARTELIQMGIPELKIWYVLPALDSLVRPRRIRIGITTRLYKDGRKREKLLVQLSKEMSLEQFSFEIFGSGWEEIIPLLQKAGAEVVYDPGSDDWQGDYQRIVTAVRNFDYYLYLGMDEGSLGTLDAYTAGVKTIVTAQGFHMSLPGGITHPFTEYQELKAIFMQLVSNNTAPGRRLSSWTWASYAREHALIWEQLLSGPQHVVSPEVFEAITRRDGVVAETDFVAQRSFSTLIRFYSRMLHPRRVLGAIARHKLMQPLRTLLRK